jgi:hypothetical protein
LWVLDKLFREHQDRLWKKHNKVTFYYTGINIL